jgi:hypothetical protein
MVPERVRNESRYTIYRLPYDPLLRGEGALRPEIQIEISVWPLRSQSVDLPVRSFVAEAFQRPPEVPNISCVSIVETAADKFVALPRRVGAEFANADRTRDDTLMRRIYDLHLIRDHYDYSQVATLMRAIHVGRRAGLWESIPGLPGEPNGRSAAGR